jgi:hypothetical protein
VFLARYGLSFYSPEDGILHGHTREHLKSYKIIFDLLFIIFKWICWNF